MWLCNFLLQGPLDFEHIGRKLQSTPQPLGRISLQVISKHLMGKRHTNHPLWLIQVATADSRKKQGPIDPDIVQVVVFHSEGHGAAGRPSVCRAFGTNGQSSSRIKNHHARRLFFLCDPRHNKNRRVVLHAGDFWHKMNRAESKQKMLRKYAAQMSSLTISGYLGFGLELLQLLRRHRLLD